MNVKKIAILALLSSGMLFASAQLAMAAPADETCADGTVANYDDNGEFIGCEAVDSGQTDPSVGVDPSGSCWSNSDGVNVCARGGVLMNTGDVPTPDPTPTDSGCTTTTDDQGVTSTMCEDVVAYNMAPGNGTLMNKSDGIQVTSEQQVVSSPQSRALALSGIMVALAGGVALAIRTNLKKN